MWPFKSKYEKLKREDVVEAICDLEKQENDLESAIVERARTIDELLERGGRKQTASSNSSTPKKLLRCAKRTRPT